jgi:hypothetical protein
MYHQASVASAAIAVCFVLGAKQAHHHGSLPVLPVASVARLQRRAGLIDRYIARAPTAPYVSTLQELKSERVLVGVYCFMYRCACPQLPSNRPFRIKEMEVCCLSATL